MTTISTEQMFTAKLTGKGLTPNGSPYIQFDWSLPGSKYPFQLMLAREPDVYDAWNVGDIAVVVICQGGLKQGKNGQYHTDYFWNLVEITPATEAPIARPAKTTALAKTTVSASTTPEPVNRPQTDPQSSQGAATAPDKDEYQIGTYVGVALNIAQRYLLAADPSAMEDLDQWLDQLQELRDRIYHHGLIQAVVKPLGYCYEHKKERKKEAHGVRWFHPYVENDGSLWWCVMGLGLVSKDQPIPEPEPDDDNELPF